MSIPYEKWKHVSVREQNPQWFDVALKSITEIICRGLIFCLSALSWTVLAQLEKAVGLAMFLKLFLKLNRIV